MRIFLMAAAIFVAAGAQAQSPYELYLSAGNADQKYKNGSDSATDDGAAYRIGAAFTVTPNFSVELAYDDFGKASDMGVDSFGDLVHASFATSAISAGVRGILPLQNGFSLIGRVGMSRWDQDVEATDSSTPTTQYSGDDSGTDPYFSIGFEYQVSEYATIGAEYGILEFEANVGGSDYDYEIERFAVTVGIKFPASRGSQRVRRASAPRQSEPAHHASYEVENRRPMRSQPDRPEQSTEPRHRPSGNMSQAVDEYEQERRRYEQRNRR